MSIFKYENWIWLAILYETFPRMVRKICIKAILITKITILFPLSFRGAPRVLISVCCLWERMLLGAASCFSQLLAGARHGGGARIVIASPGAASGTREKIRSNKRWWERKKKKEKRKEKNDRGTEARDMQGRGGRKRKRRERVRGGWEKQTQ